MRAKTFKRIVSSLVATVMVVSVVLGHKFVNNEGTMEAMAAAQGVSRVCCHDPSVVKANGQYYIFGSHMSWAKSSNLSQWSTFTNNINSNYASIFSVGAKWAATGVSSYDVSGNLWAPDVIYNPTMKKWCMYMSVNGADWNSSIALATASNIEGPYTYQGTVVYSGFNNSTHPANMTDYSKVTGTNTVDSRYLSSGKWNSSYGTNAIDPCVFYDKNGKLWMIYGSWFGGIFMLELNESTGLRDYNVKYSLDTNASDGKASDPYMGIRVAGGSGSSGEAPYIIYNNGYYYMFVSYGGFASDGGYNMRVFRSTSPSGPYKDVKGNYATYTSYKDNTSGSVGVRLMSYYKWPCMSQAEIAQGHNSALVDDNGKMFVVYHTRFNDGYEFHEVRTHQLFANQDGWLVAAPYEYLGETISSSGYSSSDMVGTYDFLVQNPSSSNESNIAKPVSITLNSNGTVSGGVSGSWSYTSGKPYMTFTYGGVTYKGVFLKQYDESSSRKEVMTFTAVGSNNICVWGSKTSNSSSSSSSSSKVTEGIYYIKNVNSGKYLDVVNGAGDNGTNIQQWTYNGYDSQKFQIKSDGNGYYYILTGASGYKSGVDIENGSSADGANVLQWEYWGGDMQKYTFTKNSDGSYAIKTKASGGAAALDVYNMSGDDGANVCQWLYWGGAGQHWVLEKASSSSSGSSTTTPSDPYAGVYFIKNVNSGKYLDVANGSADDNANIQQWSGNGLDAQKFEIVSDGNGYYYILTGASGYTKCVDIAGGKSADGTNVCQYTYKGSNNQKYKIVENNGSVAFLSVASSTNAALDVYNMSGDDGANVCQWSYWGGAGQLWTLEATSK